MSPLYDLLVKKLPDQDDASMRYGTPDRESIGLEGFLDGSYIDEYRSLPGVVEIEALNSRKSDAFHAQLLVELGQDKYEIVSIFSSKKKILEFRLALP